MTSATATLTYSNAPAVNFGSSRQLYYTIRPPHTDTALHAWMRHIISYLTIPGVAGAVTPAITQGPHLQPATQLPNNGCDGSSDCSSNHWVRDISYEEHYRKLLMSRVNAGDAVDIASVDEESLRREATLVMESANQQAIAFNAPPVAASIPTVTNSSSRTLNVEPVQNAAPAQASASSPDDAQFTEAVNDYAADPANIVVDATVIVAPTVYHSEDEGFISDNSFQNDDWDFVLYESDIDSEHDSDESDSTFSMDGDEDESDDYYVTSSEVVKELEVTAANSVGQILKSSNDVAVGESKSGVATVGIAGGGCSNFVDPRYDHVLMAAALDIHQT